MNELLLTLAEEIRQTAVWLGQEQEPSPTNIRFRLRTLREAAAMAHLNSVEAVLADLEQQLVEPAGVELEQVLEQLSSLLVSLAEPAEAREREWMDQLAGVETELDRLGQELSHGAQRLGRLSLGSDRAALYTDPDQRAAAALALGRELRSEVERLKSWRRLAVTTADRLRDAGRTLMRELAATHRIPLDPTFARLRERVRRWGRAQGRPVSLQCRATRLDIGVRQFEALARLLEGLVEAALDDGLGDPQQRRRAGLPTVANLVISGARRGSLLELRLEDDGHGRRPDPVLDADARADLNALRARLWREGDDAPGRRLVLQLPIWYSSLEAVTLETERGEVLVPLAVVERILAEGQQPEAELAPIALERRAAADATAGGPGLVIALGSWRGWLAGRVTGPVTRVVVQRAAASDPQWAIGRVADEARVRPLLHPLAFVAPAGSWRALHPQPS